MDGGPASRDARRQLQAGTFGAPGVGGPLDRAGLATRARRGSCQRPSDLLSQNLTLFAGYGATRRDKVAGRTGTPFAVYSHPINLDVLKAGLTLAVDRRTIATALVEGDLGSTATRRSRIATSPSSPSARAKSYRGRVDRRGERAPRESRDRAGAFPRGAAIRSAAPDRAHAPSAPRRSVSTSDCTPTRGG